MTAFDTFLDLLLVLATSKWAWIGVASGLACSYLVWRVADGHSSQVLASAAAFAVVFMAFAWQDLRKK